MLNNILDVDNTESEVERVSSSMEGALARPMYLDPTVEEIPDDVIDAFNDSIEVLSGGEGNEVGGVLTEGDVIVEPVSLLSGSNTQCK